MNRVLIARSFRDSGVMLGACCVLLVGFTWLRVWVASQIKADAFIKFFSESLKVFQALLPTPIEEFATPLGRVAFSYEEFGLVMLVGLWCVARGSDCIAGRVGAGTMEMLLAQPLRRVSVVASHTLVTIVGVVALAAAAWCGIGLGLRFSTFDAPPALTQLLPGALQVVGLGLFMSAAATFISALVRNRGTAVGLMIGFYIIELALTIVSRVSPRFEWLQWLTILAAYEPTMLTLGLNRDPPSYWPLFWQLNGILFGLAALLFLASAAIFSHRDVPAPL
jgi:ABC-type transport system involved in multi-copper enzyme maturation permease subunit